MIGLVEGISEVKSSQVAFNKQVLNAPVYIK